MKIAMITPGYLPVPAVYGGAVEVLIENLIEGNEKDIHHEIDLYTIDSPQLKNIRYANTNIIRVKINLLLKCFNKACNCFYKIFKMKKYTTSFARAVARKMKKFSYDYVIVQNNIMAYREIYEKTNNKDNLVSVLHNEISTQDENHVILARLIADTARKILVVSNYMKKAFLSIPGCEKANVDVLYNCIDMEQYKTELKKEEICALKKRYNISKDDFVFMYSGRIDVYKGVLELVRAFNSIENSRAKLLIVGKSWFGAKETDNEYVKELKRESERKKNAIIFTGFVHPKDMYKVYRLADCLVIPSLWEEPFGVVALEGMASKLPLIVTRSGGLVEIVDESCGLIIEKDQDMEKVLTYTMQWALNNKSGMKKLGLNGYEKITKRQDFDKKSYFKRFCVLLENSL